MIDIIFACILVLVLTLIYFKEVKK